MSDTGTLEITLVAAMGVHFLNILAQQVHTDLTAGPDFAVSNRDDEEAAAKLGARGGRLARAVNNSTENFVLFLGSMLIPISRNISPIEAEVGAIVYVCSRLIYSISYAYGTEIGIRSLAWMVGVISTFIIAIVSVAV